MEEPSEDPPLDLEEYDDADHPINETENTEADETVGVPNQPTTRVWMIEVAKTDLPENSRKILSELSEPLTAVTIKNSAATPGAILSSRDQLINRPENAEVEETEGGQKQPTIELRKIYLPEAVLYEDNRKALNEQLTGLALNAMKTLPVTVIKNKNNSKKESETNIIRETVETRKQLCNDVEVLEADWSEDNHKILLELDESALPATFSMRQDQTMNRPETSEGQGPVRGKKESPSEVPKIRVEDANRSEDYRKAISKFKTALEGLKPLSVKHFKRQDSLTDGSDTPETGSSEGDRKTLAEQLENALEATRTHDSPDTFSTTQNNNRRQQKSAEMQTQPIINVHVAQVIETALSKDNCKAIFTEQLTAHALDAVRNYAHQNLNTPIMGTESKSPIQVPEIQVTDTTLSEDNRQALTELKTTLSGMRSFPVTVSNGQDSSARESGTTDEIQETTGVQKLLCIPVYVTQLVDIDTSQVSKEDLQVALEVMRNFPGSTSKKGSKSGSVKKRGRRSRILSTGLTIGVLATNIFAFAIGFGYGWWSRHALPNFSVYELHLDPTLF